MPGPGPGTSDDRRAARIFRAALLGRLLVGALVWAWSGTPVWAGIAFVAGPAWGLAEAPSDAGVRAERRVACIDGATAGFWLLVASGLAGAGGLAALGAVAVGWTPYTTGTALAAVALVALVPVDYGLMRLGFRIAPDATASV